MMASPSALEVIIKGDNPGYATNYYFGEEDAEKITKAKSIKGFKEAKVASDFIMIDIDQKDELINVEKALELGKWTYEVWKTGGKGYHVIVPHQWAYSKDLPYSHKCFVESLGLKVDPTAYQPQRLTALPRCKHRKTGVRKHLVKRVKGKTLDLKIVEKPEIAWKVAEEEGGDLISFLMYATDVASMDAYPGERHSRLWGLAKDAARCGISFECCCELLTKINEQWSDPKDESEVRSAVEQGYKQAYE